MKEFRVAVIGLGKMGLLHAGILCSMPNVRLLAICDQKKLITRLARKVLGKKVSIVSDVRLLSSFALDAIYVTTPIPSHSKIIESIYANGIARNIFVEKTLAWRMDEADRLCEMAKSSGGVNMVGYQKRYGVTFRKAFELLNNEIIGDIIRFKAYSYSSDFVGVRKEEASKVFTSRGGVIRDLGSHAISLTQWYFGDIEVSPDNRSNTNSDYGETISFPVKTDEIEGYIEASWCKQGYRMAETGLKIEGCKGILFVNDDKVSVQFNNGDIKRWFRQDLDDTADFVLWNPEYSREDYHFVRCIANGERPNSDFLEASKVDRIIGQVAELC
jgi:predicted dehydrogenase